MPVLFDGQYLVTPTVASAIDDSQMYPSANPSGNVLVLIGESTGGLPKTPLRLRSPLHARQLFRSGPLYEAAVRAFAPSADSGSPAVIMAVRVNPATQSAVTLKSAGNVSVLNLKSTDYGAHTAAIEVRLESGTRVGYRVSVRQDGQVYARDNIGADVFSIQYSGAAATATVKVDAGNLVLEAPTGTAVKTYVLADWSSAAALVEAISGAMADWDVALTRGQERFQPDRLDKITITNAKTDAVSLLGNAYALYAYLSSASEILIDAEFASTLPVLAPANVGWTPLTGGTSGNVLAVDWEESFESLHEVDAHWLVPLSDDAAVWDMTAAHCEYMSARKRERRAYVGGDTGVTADQAKVQARSINSDRVGYVWPAIYEHDPVTRALTLKPAYLAAVHVAAGFASLNPGTTMSRKSLLVAGTETLLREPTDTDDLIQSGVCALVQSDRGVIVSQAVSTWQQDERYNRREMSVGAAVDYVARTVRAALEPLVGGRASPAILARARTRLESTLADLAIEPPTGPGVLVGGGAGSPAWRNVTLEISGDVLRVGFECSPVIPVNYVLVGISVTPYRGEAA